MTKKQIILKIKNAFAKHLKVSPALAAGLVPSSLTDGKLYEAHVLSRVLENLDVTEKMTLTLVGGANMKLKSSPGPINLAYPHIELNRNGSHVADLWTDVEFLSLSYCSNASSSPPTKGHYHELDLVVVRPGASGRPRCDEIWLGVECKNTTYQKGLLKEILGIRRELSLLERSNQNPLQYLATNPRSRVSSFVSNGVFDGHSGHSILGSRYDVRDRFCSRIFVVGRLRSRREIAKRQPISSERCMRPEIKV